MSSMRFALSSRRRTIFSPHSVGRHGDAEVELADALVLADADLDAPALRQAPLGDVEVGHDLDARGDASRAPAAAGCRTRLSTPSIRKRTQNSFSYGSMWMSEAPRR